MDPNQYRAIIDYIDSSINTAVQHIQYGELNINATLIQNDQTSDHDDKKVLCSYGTYQLVNDSYVYYNRFDKITVDYLDNQYADLAKQQPILNGYVLSKINNFLTYQYLSFNELRGRLMLDQFPVLQANQTFYSDSQKNLQIGQLPGQNIKDKSIEVQKIQSLDSAYKVLCFDGDSNAISSKLSGINLNNKSIDISSKCVYLQDMPLINAFKFLIQDSEGNIQNKSLQWTQQYIMPQFISCSSLTGVPIGVLVGIDGNMSGVRSINEYIDNNTINLLKIQSNGMNYQLFGTDSASVNTYINGLTDPYIKTVSGSKIMNGTIEFNKITPSSKINQFLTTNQNGQTQWQPMDDILVSIQYGSVDVQQLVSDEGNQYDNKILFAKDQKVIYRDQFTYNEIQYLFQNASLDVCKIQGIQGNGKCILQSNTDGNVEWKSLQIDTQDMKPSSNLGQCILQSSNGQVNWISNVNSLVSSIDLSKIQQGNAQYDSFMTYGKGDVKWTCQKTNAIPYFDQHSRLNHIKYSSQNGLQQMVTINQTGAIQLTDLKRNVQQILDDGFVSVEHIKGNQTSAFLYSNQNTCSWQTDASQFIGNASLSLNKLENKSDQQKYVLMSSNGSNTWTRDILQFMDQGSIGLNVLKQPNGLSFLASTGNALEYIGINEKLTQDRIYYMKNDEKDEWNFLQASNSLMYFNESGQLQLLNGSQMNLIYFDQNSRLSKTNDITNFLSNSQLSVNFLSNNGQTKSFLQSSSNYVQWATNMTSFVQNIDDQCMNIQKLQSPGTTQSYFIQTKNGSNTWSQNVKQFIQQGDIDIGMLKGNGDTNAILGSQGGNINWTTDLTQFIGNIGINKIANNGNTASFLYNSSSTVSWLSNIPLNMIVNNGNTASFLYNSSSTVSWLSNIPLNMIANNGNTRSILQSQSSTVSWLSTLPLSMITNNGNTRSILQSQSSTVSWLSALPLSMIANNGNTASFMCNSSSTVQWSNSVIPFIQDGSVSLSKLSVSSGFSLIGTNLSGGNMTQLFNLNAQQISNDSVCYMKKSTGNWTVLQGSSLGYLSFQSDGLLGVLNGNNIIATTNSSGSPNGYSMQSSSLLYVNSSNSLTGLAYSSSNNGQYLCIQQGVPTFQTVSSSQNTFVQSIQSLSTPSFFTGFNCKTTPGTYSAIDLNKFLFFNSTFGQGYSQIFGSTELLNNDLCLSGFSTNSQINQRLSGQGLILHSDGMTEIVSNNGSNTVAQIMFSSGNVQSFGSSDYKLNNLAFIGQSGTIGTISQRSRKTILKTYDKIDNELIDGYRNLMTSYKYYTKSDQNQTNLVGFMNDDMMNNKVFKNMCLSNGTDDAQNQYMDIVNMLMSSIRMCQQLQLQIDELNNKIKSDKR